MCTYRQGRLVFIYQELGPPCLFTLCIVVVLWCCGAVMSWDHHASLRCVSLWCCGAVMIALTWWGEWCLIIVMCCCALMWWYGVVVQCCWSWDTVSVVLMWCCGGGVVLLLYFSLQIYRLIKIIIYRTILFNILISITKYSQIQFVLDARRVASRMPNVRPFILQQHILSKRQWLCRTRTVNT